MGDALDEEKERRQQMAGVSLGSEGPRSSLALAAVHCCGKGALPKCMHPTHMKCSRSFLHPLKPRYRGPPQVRKEARAAIQRERDQQIALMVAK